MLRNPASKPYTGSGPEQEPQPTATGNKSSQMEGITKDWLTFEKLFAQRAYFSGENRLDNVLTSLLHLFDVQKVYDLSNEKSILYCEKRIRMKVKQNKERPELWKRYKFLSKQKKGMSTFCPLHFVLVNKMPLDKVVNDFPVIFDNIRLVKHALRMAWAFYLTLRICRLDKGMKFPQRFKGGLFRESSKNLLSTIFIHIYSELKKFGAKKDDEKVWIKCLKNTLCQHVSLSLEQEELLTGNHFNMVPVVMRGFFKELPQSEKVNFFFRLLQSKDLCEVVPDSFILDTLIEHREKLSQKKEPLDEDTAKYLYQRGKDFGKIVSKFYQYDKTFTPSNKATFSFTRDLGGQKSDLVYHDCLKTGEPSTQNSERMEPFVIGLFGQPGQGKSSNLNLIISRLRSLFPTTKRADLTYSRSCHTDHWDGYRNQPIVILDDIGQSLEGKDIKEFQTLVSCSPYIPPMAALEEKGIPFTSPIIILTSNLLYGSILRYHYQDSNGILDDASFWRRIHVPIYVESGKMMTLKEPPVWVREENLILRTGTKSTHSDMRTLNSHKYFQKLTDFDPSGQNEKWVLNTEIIDQLSGLFKLREKFFDNIRSTWIQKVDYGMETPESIISKEFFEEQINPFLPKSLGFDMNPDIQPLSQYLEFDAFPPVAALPVRVEPIIEPLKVRTITAGIGQVYCLKPLQRAMWLALGEEEQFTLTHGTQNLFPAIERIWKNSGPNDVWISGDYTAATDNFPIEATKLLLEGILESITHEPTKRWAMKEISPHILVYPKKSGLKPVLQESGQLMGSLLSFPLLCLLNDCTARSAGLIPGQYKFLINGDDILMRTNRNNYPKWKKEAEKFGLSLSPGKNYIHPEYGTVNSKLIFRGTVLQEGKQKVLDRKSRVLGECLRDLEILMEGTDPSEVVELFKTVNRQKLSHTVRSIRVPSSHGGLAFSWIDREKVTEKDRRTEVLVYLNDLFSKIEPNKDCLAIPYLSLESYHQNNFEMKYEQFVEPVLSKEFHEDFVGIPSLKRVQKRLMSNSHLRNLFLGQNIEDLPPLSFLKVLQVPFKDEKVRKEIQSELDRTFFVNFLDPNIEYDYELFRKSFINTIKGVKQATEVATKFLTPIIDLQVRPDYLLQVASSYECKPFDNKVFEKKLGEALKPRQFNLPLDVECEDFSSEVTTSYNEILSVLQNCDFSLQPVSDLQIEDLTQSIEERTEVLSLGTIHSHPFLHA